MLGRVKGVRAAIDKDIFLADQSVHISFAFGYQFILQIIQPRDRSVRNDELVLVNLVM